MTITSKFSRYLLLRNVMPKAFIQMLRTVVVTIVLSLMITTQVFADEITLNLKNADIRALISTVSKFTGKNFIIDPRIKAKVTVISANTLTAEEVYEVFLSVLQVHGYAAVPTGSVIKVVPEVNAKQGPLPLSFDDKLVRPADELVTKIVRLDHVPASQLVPILRPLVPQQGHLAAYNPTNTLIITDHAGNIKRLLKIIDGVDRPDSDELEIIPLKHASASELVRILNSINTTGAGKNATQKVKLAADDRTNSILVTGDRASRLKIRTTISYLDTPLEDGSGNTHVVYLKYAKAENLVKILTGLKEQNKKNAIASKVKAAPAAATTGSVISQNAIIQADEETNALIITADSNTIKNLKSVVRQLDIRRAQVLIEAIIAEITTNNDKEIGVGVAVDGANKDDGSLPVGISNFAGIGEILGAIATGTTPTSAPAGLSFGIGGEDSNGVRYGALLRALQSDTNTNILSTPNIVTLDNEEAELIVGQNLPFVTGSFTGTGSNNPNNPFQTIERQDVGLTLKVTPQINEGDTVKLVLEQETSSVIPGTVEQGIATRKRSIKTSVLVDDGGILILGGLIQEEVSDTKSKVPLLGDIPLLGALFRTESTNKSKANLMVFLRPTILRDHKDATFVTNEKYNHIRGVESEAYNKEDGSFGLLDSAAPRLPPIEEIDRSKQTIEKTQVIKQDDFSDWDDEG